MLNKKNIQDILPLLPLQITMLNTSIISGDSELYKEINCYLLEKFVDEEKIKVAWNYVIQNNEVLRTVFRWKELSQPIQVVLKEKQCNYTVMELTDTDEVGFSKCVEDVCKQMLKTEINLEEDLFRITLIKKDNNYAALIVMNHHILFDGWSNAVMLAEFFEYYKNLADNKQILITKKESYSNCVKQVIMEKKKYNKDFWIRYLSKYSEKENENRKMRNMNYGIKNKSISSFKFNNNVLKRIRKSADDNKMSLAVYFYLAWAIFLHVYFNRDNVVFGVTFSGRPDHMINCMSLLINTFPLIIHINGNMKIQEKLQELQDIINSIQENRNDSLTEIYRQNKDLSVIYFDSIIVLQNYPINNILWNNELMPITIYKRFYKSEVELNMSIQFFENIQYEFEYESNKYSEVEISNISEMYSQILEEIIFAEDIATVIRNISDNRVNKVEFKEFNFDEIF